MCRFISGDSIIGNFVIESLEKDNFRIEFEKLYNFDRQLSVKLAEYDYYTNFDIIKVIEFKENYPFLIESSDDKCFYIKKNIEDKNQFYSILVRYFRLGMPKIVINEMKIVSQDFLG